VRKGITTTDELIKVTYSLEQDGDIEW